MTVDEFIRKHPKPASEIMAILRLWITDLGPQIEEKISYGIPYYRFFGPICYLNPLKEGVDLCFTKGYELGDEHRMLKSKERKYVRSKTFYSVAEVEEYETKVRQLLNEAAILNEFQHRQKKEKTK